MHALEKHCIFEKETDVYVLFGISRKKNNGDMTSSQEVVFREVIKNKDNIEKKYTKIINSCVNYRTSDNKKLNFYVYVSVNARDIIKGYLKFKKDLLEYEGEMFRGVACNNQLKRIDSI